MTETPESQLVDDAEREAAIRAATAEHLRRYLATYGEHGYESVSAPILILSRSLTGIRATVVA